MDNPILESILKNSSHTSLLFKSENFTKEEFKQIDLNDEKNLIELEDPILINHMKGSRKKLEDYKKLYESKEIIKNKEDIDNELRINSKLSASCILSLNENNTILSNSIENLILQKSNILKLYNEENPYGFPQIENYTKITFKKIIDCLGKKISAPLDNAIIANNNLNNLEKNIKIVINDYELLIGKLFAFNQLILSKNEELINKVAELSIQVEEENNEEEENGEENGKEES